MWIVVSLSRLGKVFFSSSWFFCFKSYVSNEMMWISLIILRSNFNQPSVDYSDFSPAIRAYLAGVDRVSVTELIIRSHYTNFCWSGNKMNRYLTIFLLVILNEANRRQTNNNAWKLINYLLHKRDKEPTTETKNQKKKKTIQRRDKNKENAAIIGTWISSCRMHMKIFPISGIMFWIDWTKEPKPIIHNNKFQNAPNRPAVINL